LAGEVKASAATRAIGATLIMVFMGHILFVEKLAAPRPVVLSAGSFSPSASRAEARPRGVA
jgi:hypothetical protein